MEVNLLTGGEAGQGVQTIGLVMARTLAREGQHVFADQDYESRIRGGHSFFRIRASDTAIAAPSKNTDILVALNRDAVDLHKDTLNAGGSIIYDNIRSGVELQGPEFVPVPMEQLAVTGTGDKLMSNSVAMGAIVALTGYDIETLCGVLKEHFAKPGTNVGELNARAARSGYDYVSSRLQDRAIKRLAAGGGSRRMLLTGVDALALGAIAAGCKFAAGYPMTPASPILEFLTARSLNHNIVTIQAEDEIAAMNMVIGAAYAGARAMTATSGGGFSLMTEALSLAGMTETPVVVMLGQRPGPAIGLPTRTEQGELLFAIHAGHGEFPRAVLTPTTAGDCFNAAAKAFNLAEKYQTPAIIIFDHYLATSYSTVEKSDLRQVTIQRGSMADETQAGDPGYKRYRYSDTGISPRAFPLQGKALVLADSDEHDEEGHIIEDAETRHRMVHKRMRKMEHLKADIAGPILRGQPQADIAIVGWGSTYGAIQEAVGLLNAGGIETKMVHLAEVWPFPAHQVSDALRDSRIILVVENNATGQLAKLLKSETNLQATGSILKYDGRPFLPVDLADAVRREVTGT